MSPKFRVRQRVGVLATVIALASLGGGGYGVFRAGQSQSGGGSAGTLFVDTNGGTCQRYVGAHSYVDAEACTPGASYTAASLGDTVFVRTGTYTNWTINATPKTGGACDGYTVGAALTGCVNYQPDSGATVTLSGNTDIDSSFIRFKGFTAPTTVFVGDCADTRTITDVVMDNLTAPNLIITNIANVGILNSNLGPLTGNQIVFVSNGNYDACGAGPFLGATHIRFDNTRFHDALQSAGGQHLECLHVEPGDYITVRNSSFRNCAQHDISIGGPGPITHILFENNWLAFPCSEQGAPCQANNPIDAGCGNGGAHSDWTVRFNAIDGTMIPDVVSGCTYTGTNLFYGNIETGSYNAFQCSEWANFGWTRSYGITPTSGQSCGTNSTTANGQFSSPGNPNYNYHLANCSVIAKNFVPTGVTGGYPATDFAGTNRPVGAALDAGAYEEC